MNFIQKLFPKGKDALKLKGIVELKQYRNGKLIAQRNFHNLITTSGKGLASALLGGVGSPAACTYLAIGTGTTAAAAGDTALETEITDSGLARAAATVTQEDTTTTDDTLQLVKQWTATGTKAITEIGIFNAASAGTILGRQVFSAVNVVSGDTFQATYKVALS